MARLTESELEVRLAGEQMVHRLRDWEDGDTLYSAASFNSDYDASSGKTFRDGHEHGRQSAEEKAREMFNSPLSANAHDTVLYCATVRNPTQNSRNPADPGEPPLKYATLTDIEILDRHPPDE